MLENIKPFYSPTNICIENIYISMCEALKRNYLYMYAFSWNFGYKKFSSHTDTEIFATRLTPSRDGQGLNTEQMYALEKYCGITPIWHLNCEYANFLNIVKKELENDRPVVVGTDIFYCHWHKAANKYHTPHYCLIIGIDQNGFIAIDDILASKDGSLILSVAPKYLTLEFATLKRFNFGFLTFQISHNTPYISDQLREDIIYLSALKTLTGFDRKSDFQNMRELCDDIYKYFDITKEIAGFEDPWAIDLIRRFNYFAWSRENYNLFLKEMANYIGNDVWPSIKKINMATNLWSGIKNYVMKYAIEPDGKFDKNTICDSLNAIIKIEENLAHDIVNAQPTGQPHLFSCHPRAGGDPVPC